MSDIKHKILTGYEVTADIDGAIPIAPEAAFTFDSTAIKFDSTTRTFDETL